MYNRYVPQPDGSYNRQRVPESGSRPAPPVQREEPHPAPEPTYPPPEHSYEPEKTRQASKQPPVSQQGLGIGGFLKQLLPKDFDTGDLLIVLLLLLMAGDSPDDRNTSLLTLALYCFM